MSHPQKEFHQEFRMNHRKTGNQAEEKASGYLEQKGYQILERNFYTRYGELDIICRSPEDVLVACEVKYRASTAYGDPLEAVRPIKRLHMSRAFRLYLQKHGGFEQPARFDVIAVYGDGRICHIENAFYEGA